jgi:adenosylcobyric acid synthase
MRALARALMVQGTASSVGKSIAAAALCRVFHRDGLKVAPFKAQNMALNSFVTPDGGEIGRAQAAQAEAARIAPAVEMNPILLKPEPGLRAQVVLMGRAAGSMTWAEYDARKPELERVIAHCLVRLRESFDVVVIEGAGSPAEINLNSRDIVNMRVAELAAAPVLLVGDIDRGGVFAQFVGTMELLEPRDRARVAGFLINKFRGDAALLRPGIEFLERRCGVPVMGVLPFIEKLRIADEDAVTLDERARLRTHAPDAIEIAVLRLPSISNFDDFQPLEHEHGVAVRFVESARELGNPNLLVIPGSKSTVSDLDWLRREGFAEVIAARAAAGRPVLGICGGCQMLGQMIEDPGGVESSDSTAAGLGLLPITTRFEAVKDTAQVRARIAAPSFIGAADTVGELAGYEIHMGRIARSGGAAPAFEIVARNGVATAIPDGAISANGAIVGTMIHGIFDSAPLRAAMLHNLGRSDTPPAPREDEYDRLADIFRTHVDLAAVRRLIAAK